METKTKIIIGITICLLVVACIATTGCVSSQPATTPVISQQPTPSPTPTQTGGYDKDKSFYENTKDKMKP